MDSDIVNSHLCADRDLQVDVYDVSSLLQIFLYG